MLDDTRFSFSPRPLSLTLRCLAIAATVTACDVDPGDPEGLRAAEDVADLEDFDADDFALEDFDSDGADDEEFEPEDLDFSANVPTQRRLCLEPGDSTCPDDGFGDSLECQYVRSFGQQCLDECGTLRCLLLGQPSAEACLPAKC